MCSDSASGIDIQNPVRVHMAAPCSPYDKTPVFRVLCTGRLTLSEEIPEVHAVDGTQPELQVSLK